MTPVFIQTILAYYGYAYPETQLPNAPAYREAKEKALLAGLLAPSPSNYGKGYLLTHKGKAYVDALLAVQLPEQVVTWRVPTNPKEPNP